MFNKNAVHWVMQAREIAVSLSISKANGNNIDLSNGGGAQCTHRMLLTDPNNIGGRGLSGAKSNDRKQSTKK